MVGRECVSTWETVCRTVAVAVRPAGCLLDPLWLATHWTCHGFRKAVALELLCHHCGERGVPAAWQGAGWVDVGCLPSRCTISKYRFGLWVLLLGCVMVLFYLSNFGVPEMNRELFCASRSGSKIRINSSIPTKSQQCTPGTLPCYSEALCFGTGSFLSSQDAGTVEGWSWM